jgi:hypothetical protein
MESRALAAMALAPPRIQLNRLIRIIKGLLKVTQRSITRRPIRVEHVITRIKLDGLPTPPSAMIFWGVVPVSRGRLRAGSPLPQRPLSRLL